MNLHPLKICFTFLILLGINAVRAAETPQDRWNLADLYPSLEAWHADEAKLTAQMKEFDACRGHLADAAIRLKRCLDLDSDTNRR